jgi:hypothetical protein
MMKVMTVPLSLALRIPACTPESFAGQRACSLNSPPPPPALLPQGEKGGSRVAYATFTLKERPVSDEERTPRTVVVAHGLRARRSGFSGWPGQYLEIPVHGRAEWWRGLRRRLSGLHCADRPADHRRRVVDRPARAGEPDQRHGRSGTQQRPQQGLGDGRRQRYPGRLPDPLLLQRHRRLGTVLPDRCRQR